MWIWKTVDLEATAALSLQVLLRCSRGRLWQRAAATNLTHHTQLLLQLLVHVGESCSASQFARSALRRRRRRSNTLGALSTDALRRKISVLACHAARASCERMPRARSIEGQGDKNYLLHIQSQTMCFQARRSLLDETVPEAETILPSNSVHHLGQTKASSNFWRNIDFAANTDNLA